MDPATFKRLTDTSAQAIGMATLDSFIILCQRTLRDARYRSRSRSRSFVLRFYTEQDAGRLREESFRCANQGEWTAKSALRSLAEEQYKTFRISS